MGIRCLTATVIFLPSRILIRDAWNEHLVDLLLIPAYSSQTESVRSRDTFYDDK